MFTKLTKKIALAGCLALAAAVAPLPGSAPAYAQAAQEKPLIIIRFNQRVVFFERALYNVVSRALEVNPAMRFELIAMDNQGQAGSYGKKVMDAMKEMGVPSDRMTLRTQRSGVQYPEVHVFVR